MRKLNSKLVILAIVFLLGILAIEVSVYASNENIEIVQTSENDYLIYIKDNLNSDFEFAFSNDKDADKESLVYKIAETDLDEANANNVAFVNSTTINLFENPTYMWVKDSEGNYIVDGVQVELGKAIHKYDLEHATQITKIIPVDSNKADTTEREENRKKITTTVGKVVLPETKNDYSYILMPYSSEYSDLLSLATRVSKFNNETDSYTKINVYRSFIELVEELKPEANSNWVEIKGNEIAQPENALDGEQYILWVKETKNGNIIKEDVQFLTSHREESEERIIETITTKLPVTYDNNTLLIVLAVLVVVAVIVFIRIKTLSKKEEK